MPITANADTIFNYSAGFTGGYTEQGTVTINTVNGSVDAASIAVLLNGANVSTLTTNLQTQYGGFQDEYLRSTNGFSGVLLFPVYTLDAYAGGTLCITTSKCAGQQSSLTLPSTSFLAATSATLSPVIPSTVTPEPSSLILLGTGLVGVVRLAKRRSVR